MTYKKITATTNDIFSGEQKTIYKIVLFGGSDSATVLLENAVIAGTNDFVKLNASTGTKNDVSWGSQGLVVNYVSVTLTGTNPILYIYYV